MEKILFLDLTRGKNAVTVEKEFDRKGVSRYDLPRRSAKADPPWEPVWLPLLRYARFSGTRPGVSPFSYYFYPFYSAGPHLGGPDLTPAESSAYHHSSRSVRR